MIIKNQKPIVIIGYAESSMTQEFVSEIAATTERYQVLTPESFVTLSNKQDYQYTVAVALDLVERKNIVDFLEDSNLDSTTVIHDTAVIGRDPEAQIGHGCFVFPFSNLGIGSVIDAHTIVGAYSMIGHYSKVGRGCVIRPGVMVLGKSNIGDWCCLNARSTVVNQSSLCDHSELMGFSALCQSVDVPGKYAGTPARLQKKSRH